MLHCHLVRMDPEAVFMIFQVTPSDKDHIDGGLNNEGTFTKSKTKKPRQSTRKLYSVKLFPCNPSKNTISMWTGIYYFHTAPVVKFCYHTVSGNMAKKN